MRLKEVTDKKTAQDFLKVNVLMNRNDKNYIRPLDKDVEAVFDKTKNKAFRQGEAIRWILEDSNGELIGRVAAFTNKLYKNKGDDLPIGGMGFFDCINNQEAADMLFDVAKHWLLQRGMEAMDGPINFGERDRWWGLLVESTEAPVYCLNYNQPYYQALFENYGFRAFFHQLCFARQVDGELAPKFKARYDKFSGDPDFSAAHISKNNLDKHAADFVEVYNKAWAGHGGMKKIKLEVAKLMFQSMKPVMDEKIIWFAYHKGNPIAMWINLPDLNYWFKHLDGKFNLFAKLKFLWVKYWNKPVKMTGIVFGIVPEFQGIGIDSYIIYSGALLIQNKLTYKRFEMQWIGDFNPTMVNIAKSIDTEQSRKLTTYRYLFDRLREFKRHPDVS